MQEIENNYFSPEKLKSLEKFFKQQLWEIEHFDVDTMDDPCIFSNYWGDFNKGEPGLHIIVPHDAYDLLYKLTKNAGVTLRREGPICDPVMFSEYDPTRDESYFPIRDFARVEYNLIDLPVLYVIVRNVIDFILKKVNLEKVALLDFSKTTQYIAVRSFFTSLVDTNGTIGAWELCINLPRPHDFLLSFKRIAKI